MSEATLFPVGKHRGRAKIAVNEVKFAAAMNAVEANGPLSNRSELSIAIAAEYNKTATVKITPAVVPLRLVEFNLSPKTPNGQRGMKKGSMIRSAIMQAAFNALFEVSEDGTKTESQRLLDMQKLVIDGLKFLEDQGKPEAEVPDVAASNCALAA